MFAYQRFGFCQSLLLPRAALAGFFQVWPVLELNDQFALPLGVAFQLDGFGGVDQEVAFLSFLDVIVFALACCCQAEVNFQWVGRRREVEATLGALLGQYLCGSEVDRVIGQIFAGFDVVLILVGPVQHDFPAIVGNGVGCRTAIVFRNEVALRHEVALVIVAAEKTVEVVVDLRIVGQRASAFLSLLARLFVFLANFCIAVLWFEFAVGIKGIVRQVVRYLFSGSLQYVVGAGLGLAGENLVDFFLQFILDEGFDLGAAGVEYAVQSEIEFRLIELEELF